MNTDALLHMRLRSQLVEASFATSPHGVVSRLLAMQAQDYAGALWAIGLRLPGSTLADIEQAIAARTIVRTWAMRGTLHFVAAEDVRWLLGLLAPRAIARFRTRHEQLGLDAKTFARARKLFSAALAGGRSRTRAEAMALLAAGGVSPNGQRGYHVLVQLAHEGLLVLGPRRNKQQTFVLLDEWVPPTPQDAALAEQPREESLARLASRYLAGHGPATVADLARWAQIPKREALSAMDTVASVLNSAEIEGARYWWTAQSTDAAANGGSDNGGTRNPEDSAAAAAHEATKSSRTKTRTRRDAPVVHLLPGFDEYMLGYVGRGHQLGEHLEPYGAKVAAHGMLAPTIIVDGRAVGIWKRTLKSRTVAFTTTPFQHLTAKQRAGIAAEEERYARFLGRERVSG